MRKFSLFLLSLFCLIGETAYAATFCLVDIGLAPQCIYDDVDTCRKARSSQTASCTLNFETSPYINFTGSSRYCTVSASKIGQCIFSDREQCNREAGRSNVVCIDRTGMQDKDNPYKYDPRVQY